MTTLYQTPALHIVSLRKLAGCAGQFTVRTVVSYDGEDPYTVDFTGNHYGGPVVMAWTSGNDGDRREVFVSDAGRHGPFGLNWVRRFYAER